jgi:ferredoxin
VQLKLNGRDCISCGICMDVCEVKAIEMRSKVTRRVEGNLMSYLLLKDPGIPNTPMTFPYLAYPENCDSCLLCVNQCPVQVLELLA